MTIDHFKHVISVYAKSNNYELSPYADKIINRTLNACEGKCPCDMSRGFCPCAEHVQEIKDMGHCHCNLFLGEKEG